MLLILIGGLVFVAAAFAAMAAVMESQSRTMSNRFAQLAAGVAVDEVPEAVRGSFRERVLSPLFQRLNAFAMRLTPKASAKAMALRLERAGQPWGLNLGTWTLVQGAGLLVGIAGCLVVLKTTHLDPPLRIAVGLAIAGVGLIAPGHILDSQAKARQSVIRRALPDVIDLLVVSVEAGLGLDASVQEVIARRKGPLLDEFARVLAEIRVGKTRRAAWQEMATRVDILELKVFVAALIQAEELGSSIAGVMRGQADALRTRRSLAVREVAAMLPVKMLFPLVFFIFPGIFVVILGPGVVNIMDTFGRIGF